MIPCTKFATKSGSPGSKKPKLYDVAAPVAGSTTTSASWPKRSQNTSPGCIVATPMRGTAADAANDASSISRSSSARQVPATRPSGVAMHAHVEGVHTAGVRAGDAEHEAPEREFLA